MLTQGQIAEHVDKIDRIGYTILEGLIAPDVVAEMAAAFEPIYQANLDTIRNDPNRGPMRHHIVLPFESPALSISLSWQLGGTGHRPRYSG